MSQQDLKWIGVKKNEKVLNLFPQKKMPTKKMQPNVQEMFPIQPCCFSNEYYQYCSNLIRYCKPTQSPRSVHNNFRKHPENPQKLVMTSMSELHTAK